MISSSRARARLTSSTPMRPSPRMPNTLPRSSHPWKSFFSQRPACMDSFACGTERAIASISAKVCSATLTELPPGVFITSTPFLVAVSMSTLSTPIPARPMTCKRGAHSSNSVLACTALRTISAVASRSCGSSFSRAGVVSTTCHVGSVRSNSTPLREIFSATTIFIRPGPFFPVLRACKAKPQKTTEKQMILGQPRRIVKTEPSRPSWLWPRSARKKPAAGLGGCERERL